MRQANRVISWSVSQEHSLRVANTSRVRRSVSHMIPHMATIDVSLVAQIVDCMSLWSKTTELDILMSLIAKTTAVFFNCENLQPWIDSIVQIHPFEGVSRSTFYSCCVSHVAFFVKVSLHTDVGVVGRSQVDTEIAVLQLLGKRITRKRRSPCVLELISYKTCKVSRLRLTPAICDALCTGIRTPASITDAVHSTLCRYKDLVSAGLARDKLTFMVLDKCNFTLEDYLRKYTETPVNFAVFKALLFMVIHALCVIDEEFPGFWHADLHLRNVMLTVDSSYVYSMTQPKFVVLRFQGVQYAVPYVGLCPKLIDFGHSWIPTEGIKSPAADPSFVHRRHRNDLLFLFHCVYGATERTREIPRLLAALEPTQSYVAFYVPKIKKKVASYAEMLRNDVFDYRVESIPARYVYDEFE